MLPLRDNAPTRHFPVMTAALILANLAVWVLYQLPNLERSVNEWAYHPCEVEGSCTQIGEGWLLTAFSSMFMHGSWEHLLGNLLFLWIFGNNVEDTMGHVRYLGFYVLGGLAATALQTFVTLWYGSDQAATIPNVGASGAISAVLGAYLVLLPRARVLTFVFIFLQEIPAIFFLGFWFVFQLWAGSASIARPEEGGGVAFFAHVGGFVFGFLAVKAFQTRRPLRPRY